MSRIEAVSLPSTINYALLADKQVDNEELTKLITKNQNLKFEKFPVVGTDKFIYCDVSTGFPRPFVPVEFRHKVFESFHNLSHPGIRSTCKLIRKKFVWSSINKDIRDWARACLNCQKSKISRHVKSPIGNYPLVSNRFTEIHLDIVGRLPLSENKQYCITLIDRFTKWPEAVPTEDSKAKTVAEVIMNYWVCRYGVPSKIVMDRGSQFESELFAELSKMIGFEHNKTTAYNPACNGMIERWHRSVKAAIMCIADKQWTKSLPLVMLGLRTSLKEESQSTSAELLYGENLRLPGDFIQSSHNEIPSEFVNKLRNHFKSIKPVPASRHCKNSIFVFKELQTCSHVFIRTDALRSALQPPYEGPYSVVDRNNKYFTVLVKGVESKISINRLKPCFVESDNEVFHTQSSSAQVPSTVLPATSSEPNPKPTAIITNKPTKKSVSFVPEILNLPEKTSRTGRKIKRPTRFT